MTSTVSVPAKYRSVLAEREIDHLEKMLRLSKAHGPVPHLNGAYWTARLTFVQDHFDLVAEQAKRETGVISTAVGLITDAHQADEIIRSGKADLVAIARAMLYDPRWPWHAAAALKAKVDAPPQYWRAPPSQHGDIFNNIIFGAR